MVKDYGVQDVQISRKVGLALMDMRIFGGLALIAILVSANGICADNGEARNSFVSFYGLENRVVFATDEGGERSPYGGTKNGGYGEKKAVTTKEEALKSLKEYFGKRDVRIGEIAEKEFYFEAEIRDRNNALIDKVIVDKRTGRIRSIY
jgi:hypothetical protein